MRLKLLGIILVVASFSTPLMAQVSHSVLEGAFPHQTTSSFCQDLNQHLRENYVARKREIERDRRELPRAQTRLRHYSQQMRRLLSRFSNQRSAELLTLANARPSDNISGDVALLIENLKSELIRTMRGRNRTAREDQTTLLSIGTPLCQRGYSLESDGENCTANYYRNPNPFSTPLTSTVAIAGDRSGLKIEVCMERYEGITPEDGYFNDDIRKLCHNFILSSSGVITETASDLASAKNLAETRQLAYHQNRLDDGGYTRMFGRWTRVPNFHQEWQLVIQSRRYLQQNPRSSFQEFMTNLMPEEFRQSCLKSVADRARVDTQEPATITSARSERTESSVSR